MILRAAFAAALACAAAGAAAVQPSTTADPKAAVQAFADVCLAGANGADEARTAARAIGFAQGETLPPLGNSGSFETYHKPPLDLMIREKKSGSFGCIFLFPPDSSATNEAVAAAVTSLPGLALKSSRGNAKSWRGNWTPTAAPPGSKVVLTIGSGTGQRIAILTLESSAKKK